MFAFLPGLGMQEILVLLLLGVLLFGRKLPDVGRSIGKTVKAFQQGVRGLEEDVDTEAPATAPKPARLPERITPSAPMVEVKLETNIPQSV
jgi:sec-independent protein translocase protein TatA